MPKKQTLKHPETSSGQDDNDKEKSQKADAQEEPENFKFKGKYIEAVGRRKQSLARVRIYKNGNGVIMINDRKGGEYFSTDRFNLLKQPLKLTGQLREINLSILVKGGGKMGQAEAIRHGISRALIKLNEEFKASLKAKGWLTRDARMKERKKPGLKKARRSPQWSKR